MIQELFGGSGVGLITGAIPKLSTINGVLDSSASPSPSPSPSPSLSPSSSTATTTAAAAATATTTSSTTENLRCPRCDSSNTKFCYYNNYNLTQPRHFCKTCRRYWTKGGALRNVPIGGGCRKNKNITITTSIGKSNTAGKFKTVSSEKTNFFSGFENHVDHLSWSSPQNSHLLSLLRINQIPNPNPNLNPTTVKVLKDEGAIYGFDHPINQMGSSTGLPGPFWSNNQQQQIPANSGIILGEVQNNGLQEIYQRLRSSSSSSPNFCYPDQHAPVILGNLSSATSMASSTILDSAPVAAGGELGFWSTSLSGPISDLATTNGAYP